MKMRVVCVLLTFLFASLLPGTRTRAMSVTGSAVVGCTSFSVDLNITFDRDNQGLGLGFDTELLVFEIRDGVGSLLYYAAAGHPMGTRAFGNTMVYSFRPKFNPLTFRVISPAGNGLPEQIPFEATGYCAGLPTYEVPYVGPRFPAGFVLRPILCDTPVLNMPGGVSVGENRVKAGQTFFVDPESVEVDGQSYHEVFVSGPVNGWIASACVGK